MTGETRDGFGWEYYVGRYDGLGRRRRRWVRELRRISSASNAILKKRSGKKKQTTQKKARSNIPGTQSYDTNILQTLRQQFNFKGFGWSFNKSLLFLKSFGATVRIPLSSSLDFYDQHKAWPFISISTYFGYPWVMSTFLNASLPLEAIKYYIVGGAVWKVRWSLAVLSALIRIIIETIVWILQSPWRLWMNAIQTFSELAGRVDTERQDKKIADSLISIIQENKETSVLINGADIKMESFIELNNTTDNKAKDKPTAANAVIESPRGGATPTSLRKKHLTIFGNEIPTFHRTDTMEYNSIIQKRVGICVSWRVSKMRGYEYRCNFFFTCLPTILFWQRLDEERNRRISEMRQFRAKLFGSNESTKSSAIKPSNSVAKRPLKKSALSTFLSDHSSTLGFSAGWPLPVDPFFSFNLLLSLSGFYYGWLLKWIGSLFSTSKSSNSSKSKKLTSSSKKEIIYDEISKEVNREVGDMLYSRESPSCESEVSDFEQEKKSPVE